ncbi:MAG: transcription elongation factor GreA [Saprospiraceae bacterium]|jgi:transcription elongation factor GreA|nr:transcription elongation factor GreA [Candidatus Vicinibacter proximus]MBL7824685.1 transcription elongation factor GreA [Saprospiraceae bacterium]MCC6843993.1 transcription elongation factor GreA [Saprospiraceae bacterium]HRG32411.1 transcription elongation factor GreA [Saprospiraceae bacterium]
MTTLNYLTQEGYDRMKIELDHLKTIGRQDVAKAISEAREKGDLSENAEYHAAKDAQGMLELKINELEKKLMNVRIIDESAIDTSKVVLMTNVRLLNHKVNKEIIYKIVSEAESDIKASKISASSPIGQGLLGKKVGDKATIETPGGTMILEILEITA